MTEAEMLEKIADQKRMILAQQKQIESLARDLVSARRMTLTQREKINEESFVVERLSRSLAEIFRLHTGKKHNELSAYLDQLILKAFKSAYQDGTGAH